MHQQWKLKKTLRIKVKVRNKIIVQVQMGKERKDNSNQGRCKTVSYYNNNQFLDRWKGIRDHHCNYY